MTRNKQSEDPCVNPTNPVVDVALELCGHNFLKTLMDVRADAVASSVELRLLGFTWSNIIWWMGNVLCKLYVYYQFSWDCCCFSVTKLCLTLWHSMDRNTPYHPIPHYLPEFAQVHVHWVSNAILPSYPLPPSSLFCPQSFPASGSFPLSLLFTSGAQSIGASASASVLPLNIQGWFPLGLTG